MSRWNVEGLWACLVNSGLQSLIVVVVALLAAALTRRFAAALRHLILTAAQGAILILPLLALCGQQNLHRNFAAVAPPVQAQTSLTRVPALPTIPGARSHPVGTSPDISATMPVGSIVAPALQSSQAAIRRSISWLLPPNRTSFLLMIWALVAAVLLARHIAGWRMLSKLQGGCEVIQEGTQSEQVARWRVVSGGRRPIRILRWRPEDRVQMPMTWGVRHPVVLLPAFADSWPEDRLQAVILHELAHIRRNDWLMQGIGQVACCLYWFNPLVWRLQHCALIAAENACDDAVLLSGFPATRYAAHLVAILRSVRLPLVEISTAVSWARPSQISLRVRSILNPRRARQPIPRTVAGSIAIAFVLLLKPISEVRPVAAAMPARHATLRLQTKAYPSGKYKGSVVKRPNAPVAVPPPLAGYTHTFAGGFTVALIGLHERRADGGKWWKPDGTLVPAPIKPYAANDVLHNWSDVYHPRSLLFQWGAARDVDLSYAMQCVPASGRIRHIFHTNFMRTYERSLFDYWSFAIWFPGKVQRFTLRYGVATGPWQTVAALPVPGHVRHLRLPKDSIDGEMTLVVADRPLLQYEAPNSVRHEEAFVQANGKLIGDVARRFVAVDRDGHEHPLNILASDSDSGYIPLTFNGDSLAYAANPLDLNRIREFRLQTRPYEWAEFRDIQLNPATALAARGR